MTRVKEQWSRILGSIVADADVHLDLDVADKAALFDALAAFVAPRLDIDRVAIARALRGREQLGSTALGFGYAIPQARLPGLAMPAMAYVRVRRPLPFDAPDGRPVSDLICLFVPEAATDTHLELLAGIADLLSNPVFRAELQRCRQAAAVRRVLASRNVLPGIQP